MKTIFNENELRRIIKITSKNELDKQLKDLRFEIKRLWDFLNKQNEAIKVLTQQINSLR